MRILLLPISFLYSIVLKIRHELYDWHVLQATRFERPVICVGNLNLGGTGKTPTVEYLINMLRPKYRVATLSRGYGRKTKGFLFAEKSSTYEDLGDEPMQYATKFPDIQVAVDEDRADGVRKLLKSEFYPEAILLDDAFQHRKIKAGLNILLTEYEHLYTDDFLFPTGSLRDVKSAARRVHLIVVSKSPKILSEAEKQQIIKKLKPTAEQQVFFSYIEYETLKPLNEAAKNLNLENVTSVLLFCGIAHPKPLVDELSKRFQTVETLAFADHHPYDEKEIKSIVQRYETMEGGKIIVTTEKDAARLTNSAYLCQFETKPLFAVPIRVRFLEEEKFNEAILKYVREDLIYN
ncbi:MAG: tetraacyldisaccharide 4'-kinase [Bacteroidales bacterium]|nr:tetraacyldisaccharide 4'-kinase [Bacteroidales bacterium]